MLLLYKVERGHETMANKNLFQASMDADPANRHRELRGRAGVRARAEARAGAVRRDRLLRTDVLRDGRGAARRACSSCATRSSRSSSPRRRSTAATQSFMKDMPALLCAWLSVARPRAARSRLRARDRQRQDAAQLRADPALGRGRPEVAGNALPKRLVREWLAAPRRGRAVPASASARVRRWRTS